MCNFYNCNFDIKSTAFVYLEKCIRILNLFFIQANLEYYFKFNNIFIFKKLYLKYNKKLKEFKKNLKKLLLY